MSQAAQADTSLPVQLALVCCSRGALLPAQAVEDTVLSAGGEVWQRDTHLAGLGERLVMTVALPYLWGLPPAFDTLRCGHAFAGAVSFQLPHMPALNRSQTFAGGA